MNKKNTMWIDILVGKKIVRTYITNDIIKIWFNDNTWITFDKNYAANGKN